MHYEIQLSENRDRLWVHAPDGSTVARFSRFGIDLHNTVTDQMNGLPQCRLCTHSAPTVEDWLLFREKVREWWRCDINEDAIDRTILTVS